MQIQSVSDYERYIRWCDPRFINGEQRVEFALSRIYQVLIKDVWTTIPKASEPSYKTLSFTNANVVHAATGVLVTADEEKADDGVGFYNWLLGMSAEKAGFKNLTTDVVFVKVAGMIEAFLDSNSLWE